MPSWVRICLNSAVVIGIFAMHQMVIGPADASSGHHALPAVSTHTAAAYTADLRSVAHVVAAAPGNDGSDPHTPMSDCCGLLMLCLAMLAGVAALIFTRSRASVRVMWQLPPPTRGGVSLRLPPFNNLNPRQRSCILRC